MRCPRADLHSAPGRPWTPLVRQNDRSARSALDWDRRRRVTPAGAGSQETRPGAEPMLVATGVASPRRSAGRRARPVWRASAQQTSGAYCVHLFAKARTMDGMRLSALRLPRSFFLRVVAGMTRAQGCAARVLTLIRPRAAGEGDRALARWRGRAARRFVWKLVPALMPKPLPPCFAWSPFPASRGRMKRVAPPKPLPPRCARSPFPASRGRISLTHAGAAKDDWKCASPSARVVGAGGKVVESLASTGAGQAGVPASASDRQVRVGFLLREGPAGDRA